eukprot:TRINITY_DN19126_c0_g1_i1.p1 TRINITY_DN19126_c0_g1~~TRINITY_DN19126_c0_g1_i1.p1  ORF type:complete len:811 (+),score=213.56 TRINITY_DN19126_c0_g1_i1:50-2434(+)
MDEIEALEKELRVEEQRRKVLQEAFAKRREAERTKTMKKAQKKEFGDDEREQLKRVFKMFDTDDSGRIESSELLQMSRELDCTLSEAEVQETIAAFDGNTDNSMSFEEFLQWWGSDKALGGNKGVKLKLMKARLIARLAKNETLEKLRKVTHTELSERTVDADVDIEVGDIPEDGWNPNCEVHITALPLSRSSFEFEAKSIIDSFHQAGGLISTGDEAVTPQGFWEGNHLDVPTEVKSVIKITMSVRSDVSRNRAKELVAKYQSTDPANAPPIMLSHEEDEDGNKEQVLVMMKDIRHEKNIQQIFKEINNLLHIKNGETASDHMDQLFESFTCSIQNEKDISAWLLDEDSRLPHLFKTMKITGKSTMTRSVLDLFQKGIFTSVVGTNYYSSVFRSAVASMIGVALFGYGGAKVRFSSPADVLEDVADSYAALHKGIIKKGIDERSIAKTPQVEKLLSGKRIDEQWRETVTEKAFGYTSKELLNRWKNLAGNAVLSDEEAGENIFGGAKEGVTAPTKVQILTPYFCVTIHLKGFDWITSNLPPDAKTANEWFEDSKEQLSIILDKRHAVKDKADECFEISKLEEILEKKVSLFYSQRRIVIAGMPQSGKSCLTHRLVSQLELTDPKPTKELNIQTVRYKNKRYPVWEYWDAENSYSNLPQEMTDPDTFQGEVTLLWVVDTPKGIQSGECEAFMALIRFLPPTVHVILIFGKWDAVDESKCPVDDMRGELINRSMWKELGTRKALLKVTSTQVDSTKEVMKTIRKLERENDEAPSEDDDYDEEDEEEEEMEDDDDL